MDIKLYNVNEQPIEIFMNRDDLIKVYVRAGFTVGQGTTVEEAIADLRRELSPETRKARIKEVWGVKA